MKNVALVVAGLISVVGLVGCGKSNEDRCKDTAEITCERMYTCNTAFKFGDNQADCSSDFEALCLAGLQQSQGKCEDGSEPNFSKFDECTDKTKAQTCEQVNAGEVPAACGQVCPES